MYEEAAQEFGFEPGRFGRHEAAGIGDGKEFSDGGGIHQEGSAACGVCALLQFLCPVLGIGDPRTDTRIAFVGGLRGTQRPAENLSPPLDSVSGRCYYLVNGYIIWR